MARKTGHRPGDALARLIADILVRIVFFVAMAFFLLLCSGRGLALVLLSPEWLLVMLLICTAAAIFGPGIYRRAVSRGRGSLQDVRARRRDDR